MVLCRSTTLVWVFICAIVVGCGQNNQPNTALNRASKLLSQKDFDGCIAITRSELKQDSKNRRAWNLQIQAYQKQNKVNETIECCDQAIAACPRYSFPFLTRMEQYELLANAAQAKGDDKEYWRLQELRIADKEMVSKLDPTAAQAWANSTSDGPAILERPIPALEEAEPNAYDVVSREFSEFEDLAESDPEQAPEAEGNTAEEEDVSDSVNETPEEYASRVAREAKEIRERELSEELEDAILPPHLEPTADPGPAFPPRPITRFALPSRDDGTPYLPNFRGSVSTGIRAPSELANESQEEEEIVGPTNRFFLQNQFGLSLQGVRTGIGNSRGTTRTTARKPGRFQFQSGLIPENARDSFGPRLEQRAESEDDAARSSGEQEEQEDDEPPFRPNTRRNSPPARPNSPFAADNRVFSSALPGTQIQYGSPLGGVPPRSGQGTLSTARDPSLFDVKGRAASTNRFGNISDPSFTPFGKRPSASSTPTLPPLRTSN